MSVTCRKTDRAAAAVAVTPADWPRAGLRLSHVTSVVDATQCKITVLQLHTEPHLCLESKKFLKLNYGSNSPQLKPTGAVILLDYASVTSVIHSRHVMLQPNYFTTCNQGAS